MGGSAGWRPSFRLLRRRLRRCPCTPAGTRGLHAAAAAAGDILSVRGVMSVAFSPSRPRLTTVTAAAPTSSLLVLLLQGIREVCCSGALVLAVSGEKRLRNTLCMPGAAAVRL